MTDIGNLVKQAQAMQERMQKAQQELAATEVCGEAGGGLVKVTMTCRHDARKIEIDPSLLSDGGDSDNREVLEDLIAAAINDAVRKVEAVAGEKMGGLVSGLSGAGLNLANFKPPV
ncbi:MAG: YbaB/EbfC family nucleoid-associated protein [Gammaproteobacteria bacterium]|nr:YbaB/EbfC family nucleoid-associated protein [Gammaproteobacteria bacterium]MDA7969694.1 YbaB/EbfC family nucleoid-associated protein [Gammaproteobacteria bacterium]MDA7971115.1 YbaB/EbfC family nucleoid-associated protein [Gammaproteobacteria bacterium]MDA8024632.1 YbaB/EbfC family nucleoid-associated protein [Gammaproteobacteria bacterium]CAJ2377337.1 MAG: putative nucleoid-associated protein YbaB [Arenicellales bacterium IbO2]